MNKYSQFQPDLTPWESLTLILGFSFDSHNTPVTSKVTSLVTQKPSLPAGNLALAYLIKKKNPAAARFIHAVS